MSDNRNKLIVMGIDPGTSESAYTVFMSDGKEHFILDKGKIPNEELLKGLRNWSLIRSGVASAQLSFGKVPVYIEGMQAMGMPVGKEVFDTCYLIGRITEILESGGVPVKRIYRSEVKLHHCHTPRAKDANIRAALIERFGAVGTKNNQGILYGVSADVWSSTAIAVMGHDREIGIAEIESKRVVENPTS